jgi:adenylate kinase
VTTTLVGANEVQEEDDMFIITAPQNAVGNCIIDDLKAMVNAAGNRPVIIVNPRLKDVPGSGGVMQVNFILPYTYIAAAYHLD